MTPAKPKKPTSHTTPADSTQAVDELMSQLAHPFKDEVQAIRRTLLGVDPSIAEGVKWKAPSFRTTEYFATTHLREKNGIGLILHLGAKARELPPQGVVVEDPQALLKWLAKDRAMIVFKDMDDFMAKKAAFEDVIRHWIAYV